MKQIKYWWIRFTRSREIIKIRFDNWPNPELGMCIIDGLYNDQYMYVGRGKWLYLGSGRI